MFVDQLLAYEKFFLSAPVCKKTIMSNPHKTLRLGSTVHTDPFFLFSDRHESSYVCCQYQKPEDSVPPIFSALLHTWFEEPSCTVLPILNLTEKFCYFLRGKDVRKLPRLHGIGYMINNQPFLERLPVQKPQRTYGLIQK